MSSLEFFEVQATNLVTICKSGTKRTDLSKVFMSPFCTAHISLLLWCRCIGALLRRNNLWILQRFNNCKHFHPF